jgi:hypothetical protein
MPIRGYSRHASDGNRGIAKSRNHHAQHYFFQHK